MKTLDQQLSEATASVELATRKVADLKQRIQQEKEAPPSRSTCNQKFQDIETRLDGQTDYNLATNNRVNDLQKNADEQQSWFKAADQKLSAIEKTIELHAVAAEIAEHRHKRVAEEVNRRLQGIAGLLAAHTATDVQEFTAIEDKITKLDNSIDELAAEADRDIIALKNRIIDLEEKTNNQSKQIAILQTQLTPYSVKQDQHSNGKQPHVPSGKLQRKPTTKQTSPPPTSPAPKKTKLPTNSRSKPRTR